MCCHCLDLHKRGALTFSEVEEFVDDRGKSCLYRLKQMSHELFRNTPEAAYKEKFFDITVGYIFHEAMKLRECIYQLEYYKPQYSMLISSPELTPAEKKVIREFDALILKAQKRLNEGLKEVRTLLKDLLAQVKDLVKIYRNNYLLPRFLLENERSFIAMYGKKGYQGLLDDIYDRGRSTLIFKAAVSYLRSEYYQVARSLFQKATKLDRANVAARFLFLYTSAFNCYFRNRFSMAKIFAEEALAMPIDGQTEVEAYAQSLRDLLPDLAKEMGRAG
jgi:tetratricopeptide (TPR) repeat protein